MNRKKLFRASAAALLAAASLSAAAALPDGVRTGKDGTVVTISAEATLSQANDEATVNLYYTETGKDAATVAKHVIERTNAGLEALKGLNIAGAKFESTQLSSWPQYVTKTKGEAAVIGGWEVRQSLQVKVKNAAEAAQVAQAAQQYFAFESVNFSLSREAKQAMQHALTRLAVERVADRAVEVAKAMGKPASAVQIENLNFGHSGYVAPRMLRANKMMAVEGAAMSAAPVLEAGDTSVTLNVDAQVRID